MVSTKMFMLKGLLGLAAIGGANPVPEPEQLDARAVNCGAVNVALGVLKILGPPATSFCKSYLAIPATVSSTITITGPTPIAVTVITSTVVSSTRAEFCNAGPAKRNVFDTREVTFATRPAQLDKRLVIPTALKLFGAAQLSSGCSCLNLAPKTATITATATPPDPTVGIATTTTVCEQCTQTGLPCDFNRPDLCCGLTCSRYSGPLPGVTATCYGSYIEW